MLTPEEQNNPDVQLVNKYAKEIGEHFDTVHIFATRHEEAIEGGTITVSLGTGNWYARYGQVVEWLVNKDEETRLKVRKYDQ